MFIMKKFTLFLGFALFLCGSVLFAQNTIIKIPANMQNSTELKAGWVGNSQMLGGSIVNEGGEYAIRIAAGSQTSGDEITKVKFYSDHENYTQYGATNTSYVIKIYEGGSFNEEAGFDDFSAAGTEVYTQNYTATTSGPQEVELNTAYTIGSQEFWVSIYCNGTSLLALGADNATTLNDYVYTINQEGTWYWVSNEFCQDQECTVTTINPFYLSVYVDDGAVYEETSDIAVMGFIDNMEDQNWITNLELSATDSLTIYPVFANNGPDNAVDLITVTVSIDAIDLSESFDVDPTEFEGGSFPASFLSAFPLGLLSAADMDAFSLENFEVCVSLEFAGSDPNLTNNEDCLNVSRDFTSISNDNVNNIAVYPNPATDLIYVSNAEGAEIEIVNMLGKVVAKIDSANNNQLIDLSEFAEGNYFIKVNDKVFKLNLVK
jgi:hypothetical protein